MLGKTLNHRYQLEQVLARTPSGILYLATDSESGELLAVKIFPPSASRGGEHLLRYRRVMNRLSGADHPHLLHPLLTGEFQGTVFQVLPYFPSQSLEEVWQAGAMSLEEGLALLRQGASGLACLHSAGVVHLNVKPANLLVSREAETLHFVLTDAARPLLLAPDGQAGQGEGAAFIAPEQTPWLDLEPDRRTDLYALGLVAYQSLTGVPPFTAQAPRERMRHHLATPVPPPRQFNESIPAGLEAILLKLLAKNPAHRYQTAEGLLEDLQRFGSSGNSSEDSSGESPVISTANFPLGLGDPADPFAVGTELVGRNSAQERLRTALARAVSGQGGLVMLRGEAGSGRGSLMRDLLPAIESARGLLLRVTAPAAGWCPPFHLPTRLLGDLLSGWETLPDLYQRDLLYRLHQAVGDQAEVLNDLVPALAPLLPAVEARVSLPLGRERMRTLGLLAGVFLSLAEPNRPLVIWIEELQWADPDSLEWLGRLAQRLEDTPLLVIASAGPGASSLEEVLQPWLESLRRGEDVHWIEVPPLTGEQCAEHLAGLLGADSPNGQPPGKARETPGTTDTTDGTDRTAKLAAWMMERWGGRPLAISLALRLLKSKGMLQPPDEDRKERSGRSDQGGREWRVDWEAVEKAPWPESFPALVQHRLEFLPDEVSIVLQAAAMYPGEFSFASLTRLLDHYPPPMLQERLEAGIAEGLLQRGGACYRFAHPTFREVIRRHCNSTRLEELHRTLAALSEAAGLEAAGLERESAKSGLSEPGLSEPGMEAHHETALHFQQGGDEERFKEHGFLAMAAAWQHKALHGVRQWSERLKTILGNDERIADLLIAGGIAHAQLGEEERALAMLDSALALSLSEEARLEAISHAAWIFQMRGEHDRAIAKVEEGLVLTGENLPANPVGTALARLTGRTLGHYETLRSNAGGAPLPALDAVEERLARLLALASGLLAQAQPQRAVLADEKIVRLAAGRVPSEHLVRALVRLGEAEGDPEGVVFSQAHSLLQHQAFPYAEAEYHAAVGRCWLGKGKLNLAAESLEMALAGFRAAWDLLGEAESLMSLAAVERLRGPATGFPRRLAELRRIASCLSLSYLNDWAKGAQWYADAAGGASPPAEACAGMRAAAIKLQESGRTGEARFILALSGEVALIAEDLGELLETVRIEGMLPHQVPDPQGLSMRSIVGEAQLQQAMVLPDQRDFHLAEARSIKKILRQQMENYPLAKADVLRMEIMESLVRAESPPEIEKIDDTLAGLEMDGANLHAALLRLAAARAYQTREDPAWMRWCNKALEDFRTLGAQLHADAARTMLDLPPALPDSGPPRMEQRELGRETFFHGGVHGGVHGGHGGGEFSGLLEQLGRGEALAPPPFHRALLQSFLHVSDGEYAGLYRPNADGQLTLVAQLPETRSAGERMNRWLAESVWSEGVGRVLDNYQPPPSDASPSFSPSSSSTPLAAAGESQSQVGVPVAAAGVPYGVVVMGSGQSRLVFDRGHLERLSALGREAGAVAAINGKLHDAGVDRERLQGRLGQQAQLLEWMPNAAAGEGVQEIMEQFFHQVAAEAGYSGALLCFLEPGQRRLTFGVWRSGNLPPPNLENYFPLPVEGGQSHRALETQAPVAARGGNSPPLSDKEQALLTGLGAGDGLWLPLTIRGEAFALVLLTVNGVGDGLGDGVPTDAGESLLGPLRLLAPSLYHAWRLAGLDAAREALQERERSLLQTGRFYRRFLPPGMGETEEEIARTVREGAERIVPVLAGNVPGLAEPLGLGKSELMHNLRGYFGRVDQALSLHQGRLHGIHPGGWSAHFPPNPDNVLWAVQTLYQMLTGLREEATARGQAFPPTGLGLHLGPTVTGALPAGDGLTPFIAGAGVRTAMRLASMSITFRCGILVSQAMVEALESLERFDLRHLGKLRPAAGENRLDVYELYSVREEQVRSPMRDMQEVWEEALREYRMGRWRKAAGGFGQYIAQLPQDRPARYFLRQCRQRQRA